MKAYRYNSARREDRQFNDCGKEKNPNMLRYYASNLDYAENYRYVHYEDGDIAYECELEIVEVPESIKLFDMAINFKSTSAYVAYINSVIGAQLKDYKSFLESSKTKKDVALWTKEIKALENREEEIKNCLISNEFQQLSDFDLQNVLVAELKDQGFEGYFTANEIVLF